MNICDPACTYPDVFVTLILATALVAALWIVWR